MQQACAPDCTLIPNFAIILNYKIILNCENAELKAKSDVWLHRSDPVDQAQQTGYPPLGLLERPTFQYIIYMMIGVFLIIFLIMHLHFNCKIQTSVYHIARKCNETLIISKLLRFSDNWKTKQKWKWVLYETSRKCQLNWVCSCARWCRHACESSRRTGVGIWIWKFASNETNRRDNYRILMWV